jgi:hypothetical protein
MCWLPLRLVCKVMWPKVACPECGSRAHCRAAARAVGGNAGVRRGLGHYDRGRGVPAWPDPSHRKSGRLCTIGAVSSIRERPISRRYVNQSAYPCYLRLLPPLEIASEPESLFQDIRFHPRHLRGVDDFLGLLLPMNPNRTSILPTVAVCLLFSRAHPARPEVRE